MNEDPFMVGDVVYVTKLHRTGTVLQILPRNRLRVRVQNMEVTISNRGAKKHAAPKKDQPHRNKERWKQHIRNIKSSSKNHPPQTLDLHGCSAMVAEERVIDAINSALLRNDDQMIIIHGHGTGVLRKAVEKILSSLGAVKAFKIDPNNSGQTIVYF